MAFIRFRTFLWCFSLRTGILILATWGLVEGGLGSAGSWVQVILLKDHPLPLQSEIALFVQAILFTLLGPLSMLVLLGAIIKSRSITFVYSKLLAIHLGLSFCSEALTLYSTLQNKEPAVVNKCINGSQDPIVKQICSKGWSTEKGLFTGLSILMMVSGLYAYFISTSFTEQLEVDEAALLPKFEKISAAAPLGSYRSMTSHGQFRVSFVQPFHPSRARGDRNV